MSNNESMIASFSHLQANELLPWYANATLADNERLAVDEHVKDCPDCQRDLELLQMMQVAAQDSNTIPIVPDPDVERLLEKLDTRSGTTRTGHYLAGALVAAATIAALALLTFLDWRSDVPEAAQDYRTVIEPGSANVAQYIFEIRFHEAVSAPDRQRLLEEFGASDITVDDNVLRAVISRQPLTVEELQRLSRDIQALEGVVDARVTAMQIPLEPLP